MGSTTGAGQAYPFNLNSAVDELLKREFDQYRKKKTPHPLMEKFGIDAISFQHDDLGDWRNLLSKGIQFHHEKTDLLITGGVDDVWENKDGELLIVNYKVISKNGDVNLDAPWQISYKRQMELYQWLFKKNGFKVNRTGYFVYCPLGANSPPPLHLTEFRVTGPRRKSSFLYLSPPGDQHPVVRAGLVRRENVR